MRLFDLSKQMPVVDRMRAVFRRRCRGANQVARGCCLNGIGCRRGVGNVQFRDEGCSSADSNWMGSNGMERIVFNSNVCLMQMPAFFGKDPIDFGTSEVNA